MRKNAYFIISLLCMCIFLNSSCSSTKSRVVSSTKTHTKRNTIHSNLRNAIVSSAKKYLGTVYKYGGKSPKAFDCSGYTAYVMKENGINISGNSTYQSHQGKRTSVSNAKKGDLMFFGNKGQVSHVGIVVEHKKDKLIVIHSTSSKGVVTSDVYASEYWKKRALFARNIIN